jgi:mannitol-1-phosphate/altronate dehydrogenase
MTSTHQASAASPLREGRLATLARRVSVPTYRRDQLSTGVVHLGVGNFHRAHQAVYFDQLAELGMTQWGLTGVGFRSRAMKDALSAQDHLFTVVEQDGLRSTARIVGSMLDYVHAPSDPARALAALASDRTWLVTLTLTGDGYPVDADGDLVVADDDVAHDLDPAGCPRTAFGYLADALARRHHAGGRPLTILSCDNLPDSGQRARAGVLAMADRRHPRLGRWISEQVSFPDAMVDRITPAATPENRSMVGSTFGVQDRSPVMTERFSQWVVQDAFAGDRPPLEQVGVQFVPDVAPYKLMKTRLLNGSHCALGYLGTLAGHHVTSGAMADPLLRAHLKQMMAAEIAPLLPELRGVDMRQYQATLLERFANPHIADPLSRLCGRGSTKMPAYVLPSLHEALQQARPHGLLTLTLAAWLRYLRGTDLEGRPLHIQDAHVSVLHQLAVCGGNDPRPLLSQTHIFGRLRDNPAFLDALQTALTRLDQEGLRAGLAAGTAGDSAGTRVRWITSHQRGEVVRHPSKLSAS